MKALILTDSEYKSESYVLLCTRVKSILAQKGYEPDIRELGKTLSSCMGCFGCWIKKPGECVIQDEMANINRQYVNSDAVVFISPIIYGQFSAPIKNALDRTLPRLLPFFYRRKDGSTMHPQRYGKIPVQIVIGYGSGLTGEETTLFRDITLKHRTDTSLEIWQNDSDTKKIETLFGSLNTKERTA
jgi:multimeric flavodoxin WrbA